MLGSAEDSSVQQLLEPSLLLLLLLEPPAPPGAAPRRRTSSHGNQHSPTRSVSSSSSAAGSSTGPTTSRCYSPANPGVIGSDGRLVPKQKLSPPDSRSSPGRLCSSAGSGLRGRLADFLPRHHHRALPQRAVA